MNPDLKDKVLKYVILRATDSLMEGSLEDFAREFEISSNVTEAILRQFHRKGLIEFEPFMGGNFYIRVAPEAHDYLLMGGHLGEFEFLEMQIQKLKNDLYAFETSIPKDKFDDIIKTANIILTAASTFHQFK
ncbi:MAG: hypothetical protein NVS9B7_09500 [Flavisolibacter sp.]